MAAKPPNPYLTRTPIAKPELFFGRRRELDTICAGLGAETPQSFSVVGDRRIGKTSLLLQVLGRHARGELAAPVPTVFVRHDFQSRCPASPDEFRAFVLDEAARSLGVAHPPAAVPELGDLLRDSGRRLVFVWDEFEVALRRSAASGALLEELRSLSTGRVVAFLTATLADLQSMCPSRELAGSSFFNVFHRLVVVPLDREAALELIRGPSAAAGVPLAAWSEQLVDLGGTFPILLQAACAACFDHLRYAAGAEPDWNEVQMRFADAVDSDLKYMLGSMSDDERAVCRSIVDHRPLDTPELRYALRSLLRRGCVVKRGAEHALFSACLAEVAEMVLPSSPSGDKQRDGREARHLARLSAAIKACNDIVGYHNSPLVFESIQDLFGAIDKLLQCPASEEELHARVSLLWRVAYEATRGEKGGSRIPQVCRQEYYRSRPILSLVALRNFCAHSKIHLSIDEPSQRYSNVGEIYSQYLSGARRCIAGREDCGTVFDGLFEDTCLQIEALASALRCAGERGELKPPPA
jgi:hypothetical protein